MLPLGSVESNLLSSSSFIANRILDGYVDSCLPYHRGFFLFVLENDHTTDGLTRTRNNRTNSELVVGGAADDLRCEV